jgi:N-dimethylarginine dimethylaminohydrolase
MTMTTTSYGTEQARAHLEEARDHYEAFCESMRALGCEVRWLDEWQYQRVDAYPG